MASGEKSVGGMSGSVMGSCDMDGEERGPVGDSRAKLRRAQ